MVRPKPSQKKFKVNCNRYLYQGSVSSHISTISIHRFSRLLSAREDLLQRVAFCAQTISRIQSSFKIEVYILGSLNAWTQLKGEILIFIVNISLIV